MNINTFIKIDGYLSVFYRKVDGKGGLIMKEDFEAEVWLHSYNGWNGWVEETLVATLEGKDFEDRLEPFIGKKVRIIIEEIE